MDEITQLKARYLHCIDTRQWDGLASLFTSDAAIETEEPGVRRDLATFIARVSKLFRNAVTLHTVGMQVIALQSDTQATAIWTMEDRIWFHPRDGIGPPRYWQGAGRYHDNYVYVDGHWRICHLRLLRDDPPHGASGDDVPQVHFRLLRTDDAASGTS